jgi:DUF1680 family protein
MTSHHGSRRPDGAAATDTAHDVFGRRELLIGAAAGALAALATRAGAGTGASSAPTRGLLPARAAPFPLSAVRLQPSRYLDAVEANRRYVLGLDPDRLLHNFRASAGLVPKAPPYGGWEADTIAGHTLGHWLSALSLLHAQTGDLSAARVASYVVAELADCQAAHGDGYVAGFTRRRADGTVADGKELFAEIRRGEIRSAPFDLNGCWVPFYNWHKLLAGLHDADRLCGLAGGVEIARALGGYVERLLAALDEEQMQQLLACEHGGINESFAELAARTGESRWLALAERFYHRRVLEPLAARRDELAGLHANTQIPKLIGLARLHELTGNAAHGTAARFFWEAVTRDHSYVIGGNSDREYFQAAGATAGYLTEQTCEGCNTYNMLKLTRLLYAAAPDGALFDYYERAHLNHVLAQQDPANGAFTYMTPLMSGVAREYSDPVDSFWCCVGSGMESHAKHGDSIYWHGADTLFVNLYIPSTLSWRERGAVLALATRYPHDGLVELRFESLAAPQTLALAFREPRWSRGARLTVNGREARSQAAGGYRIVRRRWRAGDVVALDLPLALRLEATPDDPQTVALLRGPLVLAADLGAADTPSDGHAPVLVADDPLAHLALVDRARSRVRSVGLARPRELEFLPFHEQHRRRSAVYFRRLSLAEWQAGESAVAREAARALALDARSVDSVQLGEESSEQAHGLTSAISYAVTYRGRSGRDARSGGFMAFSVSVRPGPLVLRLTYWGEERPRSFVVRVDGTAVATQHLGADHHGRFADVDYPLPAALTQGKERVTVRIEPEPGSTAGPVFGCRVLAPAAADSAA